MTLQRELSDRDRTNGKADNKSASNAELPALDAHRRAISAPGTTMLRPGTGNVDVIKTLQRNQALINEVTDRRFENDKLRQDNAALLLHAKDASLDSLSLRNHVATSLADREELIRRLRKADSDAKRWKDQLNSIARKASRQRFEEKVDKEEYGWSQIEFLSQPARRRSGDSFKSPSRTRNIQVEKWANFNTVEL
eukprot:m.562022 g.562022  ORF g.562022 m.562022 type:complete len:195 (-) comp22219_c0_seq4:224-808(-)